MKKPKCAATPVMRGAEVSTYHHLLDQVVEEDAGQNCAPTCIVDWERLAEARDIFSPPQALIAFQERLRTLSVDGPCSAPPLWRLPQKAAASSWLVQVVAVIPKPDGGHQR